MPFDITIYSIIIVPYLIHIEIDEKNDKIPILGLFSQNIELIKLIKLKKKRKYQNERKTNIRTHLRR